MSNDVVIRIPNDANQRPINRAMGIPIASPLAFRLGSSTKFVDLFDLVSGNLDRRAFTGFSVENPGAQAVILSFGPEFSENRSVRVGPTSFMSLDNQTFGTIVLDDTTLERVTRVRAKLEASDDGVFSFATIDYSGSGNPADEQTIEINGKIYEFSNDMSKAPSHDYLVEIGASDDDSYNNLLILVNSVEQALTATINTGTDLLTLTSNYGGAYGDGLVVVDGSNPTGAAFSGNTSGGSGGVLPVIHIW